MSKMPQTSSSSCVTLISKCTIVPNQKSNLENLKFSVSDLPMLSCQYIQKGCLFTQSPTPIPSLISLLKLSLSKTLSLFPPLAGRLITDHNGHIYITCNDAGADFIHANAENMCIHDLLSPMHVPEHFNSFFAFDKTVSYEGHFNPILAVQVTELEDGVFIGCSVNHAVVDGTSLWNFFNTFAEVCKTGERKITRAPDFSRDSVLISQAVLKIPHGGPKVTFNQDDVLSERIFSFNKEAILKLKSIANSCEFVNRLRKIELMEKQKNDVDHNPDERNEEMIEISSFQSLCALLWRAVTRARNLPPTKMTTFRMAVNIRHRLTPKLSAYYFGNAIQSTPTSALAGEVIYKELGWCAENLRRSVVEHRDEKVLRLVEEWEGNPRLFPLGNEDGAMVIMGSSPRFPMYENDFGWGKPIAVRSGRANKFDGKISAFPGRHGGGTVDLEVVLREETMRGIESDAEFMQYVSF